MRRWILYLSIAAFAALLSGIAPGQGRDVSELMPVELVRISVSGGQVVLETDTGNMGAGKTVEAALDDMKATTAGTVFLDTADFLVVAKGCEGFVDAVSPYLRPACAVCLEDGKSKLEEAVAFLNAHEPQLTLQDWRTGEQKLPVLQTQEGRMRLDPG